MCTGNIENCKQSYSYRCENVQLPFVAFMDIFVMIKYTSNSTKHLTRSRQK